MHKSSEHIARPAYVIEVLNSQLHSNRAHVRLLLRQFAEAVDDCRKATCDGVSFTDNCAGCPVPSEILLANPFVPPSPKSVLEKP